MTKPASDEAKRKVCSTCRRGIATQEEWDTKPGGWGPHLCWEPGQAQCQRLARLAVPRDGAKILSALHKAEQRELEALAELDEVRAKLAAAEAAIPTGPQWTCACCGERERFRTVEYGAPSEPKEYDMECLECGSTSIMESPREALGECIAARDRWQMEAEEARDLLAQARAELAKLKEERDEAREALSACRVGWSHTEVERNQLRAELAQANAYGSSMSERVAVLRDERDSLSDELAQAKQVITLVSDESDDLDARLLEAQVELHSLREENSRLSQRCAELEKALRSAREELRCWVQDCSEFEEERENPESLATFREIDAALTAANADKSQRSQAVHVDYDGEARGVTEAHPSPEAGSPRVEPASKRANSRAGTQSNGPAHIDRADSAVRTAHQSKLGEAGTNGLSERERDGCKSHTGDADTLVLPGQSQVPQASPIQSPEPREQECATCEGDGLISVDRGDGSHDEDICPECGPCKTCDGNCFCGDDDCGEWADGCPECPSCSPNKSKPAEEKAK